MFGNSYGYQALAQKDSPHVTLTGPGLFSSAHYGQKGHSFDYVPRVTENDFTGNVRLLIHDMLALVYLKL